MSGHIVELNGSAHQRVQEALPWFVLDRLGSEERAMVLQHMQGCTLCQEDAAFQRKLLALQLSVSLPNEAGLDVDLAFAKLKSKLTAPVRPAHSLSYRYRIVAAIEKLWGKGSRPWMPWALGAQFVLISGLCAMLLQPATYHGLGMYSKVDGNMVVMFKPQTTEQELRRILHASGARVVDGPTVTDAYLLNVRPGQEARALGMLRAEPAVSLVESLESRGAH